MFDFPSPSNLDQQNKLESLESTMTILYRAPLFIVGSRNLTFPFLCVGGAARTSSNHSGRIYSHISLSNAFKGGTHCQAKHVEKELLLCLLWTMTSASSS
jgi:hypothetical protein